MSQRVSKTTSRMAAPAVVAVLLVGCSESVPTGADDATGIAHPTLDRYERGVAAMLGDEIARYDAAVSKTDATPAELAEAAGRLGMVYQAHHLTGPALDAYAKATTLAPGEFRWHYYRGVLLADAGRPDDALAAFERAAALRPDDMPTRLRTGAALLAAGRADEARGVYESVVERQPQNAAALAGAGRAAIETGDYAAAVDALSAALDRQPGATKLHHPLALALRAVGDTNAARRHLSMRGDAEPAFVDPLLAELAGLSRSAQYYLARGQQALEAGNPDSAAEDFRRAVEFNPDDVTARATYGRTLQDLGRSAAAMREFEAALAIDPQHAVVNYFKGALHERLGDDANAMMHYRASLETDPEAAEPRLLLANALMRARQFDDAAGHYARLAEDRPRSVQVRYWLGLALMAARRCGEAAAPLETAREINPGYGPVLIALARRDASCGDAGADRLARAVELGTALFDARPDYETAATLAMALAAVGRFDNAVAMQRRAQTLAETVAIDAALTDLAVNLERFVKGQRATRAWPPNSPAYFPPPLQQ